jgi:hypothetical protein
MIDHSRTFANITYYSEPIAIFLDQHDLYNDNERSGIQSNFGNKGIEPIAAIDIALFHFFRDV